MLTSIIVRVIGFCVAHARAVVVAGLLLAVGAGADSDFAVGAFGEVAPAEANHVFTPLCPLQAPDLLAAVV